MAITRNTTVKGGYVGLTGGSPDWTDATRVTRTSMIDLTGATNTRAFSLISAGYKKPLLDGLTISNADYSGSGGAVYFSGGFQAGGRVNDVLFENNKASGSGGALYISASYGGNGNLITNSEFRSNSAATGGAAHLSVSNGSSAVLNSVFEGNRATEVGALHIAGSVTVADSLFVGNFATKHSGAIGNDGGGANITVRRSIFTGNSTDGNGAVAGIDHSFHPKYYRFENSLIYDNTGNYALYHYGTRNPDGIILTYSTVADNPGGGVYSKDDISLVGSVIANNGPVGVYSDDAGATLEYNDVWGHTSDYAGSATAGVGSMSIDPSFVDALLEDYRILSGSGVIGAWPGYGLTDDLLSDPRAGDDALRTLGAYETPIEQDTGGAAIPEPATLALVACGGAIALRRRRR